MHDPSPNSPAGPRLSSCRTAASLFTPSSSTSPKLRAFSRYVTWPRCKMSKQPLVTTSFLPLARNCLRHAGKSSHAMILSRKFTPSFCLWIFANSTTSRRATPRSHPTPARRNRAAHAARRRREFPATGRGSLRSTISPHCRDNFSPPRPLPAKNPTRARQRLAKIRECPGPRRAVVVGGFAARVLVAFVTRPIGIRPDRSATGRRDKPAAATDTGSGASERSAPGTTRYFCAAATQRFARSPVTRPRLTANRQLLRNASSWYGVARDDARICRARHRQTSLFLRARKVFQTKRSRGRRGRAIFSGQWAR